MSAVDKAFHGLRHMIATGRLGPGERMPPEADLCEELGVSRGSLREAVRMLAALGVAEPRHGSGTYVSQLRPEDLIGSLSLTLQLLPLPGLLEVYEIRRVLEAHVAAKAAARATPETVGTLFSLIASMEASVGSSVASMDAMSENSVPTVSGVARAAAFAATWASSTRRIS